MNRGIVQLQRLKLCFCDWSGSTKGVRNFMNKDEFYNFVNKNQMINFEFYLRRGRHPFIRAIFANGFEKDIPLINKNEEEVYKELQKLKANCK